METAAATTANNVFYKLERNGQGFIPRKSGFQPLKSRGVHEKSEIELKQERLKKASKDFEAIFIRQFMRSMRTSMLSEGMFGDGSSGEIYADMMDAAVADQLSARGVLGISDVMYRQLIKGIGGETDSGEKIIK